MKDLPQAPTGTGGPALRRKQLLPRAAIFAIFFLTGASALAYEVVWTRWMELLLGNTTHAATAVLAAFMGGLALGGALFGRLADRTRSRLFLYGWLEIAVGLYAMAFPVLLRGGGDLYLALARPLGDAPLLTFSLRFGIALILVLVPTTLMGGTLPILVRFLSRRPERVGRGVAWLYFLNSAGAAAGCAVAGFHVVGTYGLLFTSSLAVVINLGAGLAALALRHRVDETEQEPAEPETAPPRAPSTVLPVRQVATVAILSGAAAMAYELGWFRLLALVLGSSADAFTLMLATFIGGLSLGSLWASRRIDRWPRPERAAASIQIAIALFGIATLPLSMALPGLSLRLRALAMGSYGLYQAMQFLLCAVLMAAPTFLLGVSFPLLARLAASADSRSAGGVGGRVGGLVAWTTTGNIAGTLAAGLILIPLVGVRGTFTVAAMASVAAGLAVDPPRPGRALRLAPSLAAVVFLAVAPPGWDLARLTGAPFRVHDPSPAVLQGFLRMNQQRDVLLLQEDAGATVSVERQDENLVLRINGKPDASLKHRDMLTQRLIGHYPMLFHPDPRDVMLIGLGSGITAGAVLQHPVDSLSVAEISSGVVEASRLFEPANHRYWEDPRLRIRVEDARNVLLVEDRRYDVVISEPSNLWMAGVAGLYTREFYGLVRSRLRPGGMLVQWVHSYEMDDLDLRMVLRTLRESFPHLTVFRAAPTDLEIIASTVPFDWDWKRIDRRLEIPGVREDMESLGILDQHTLLTNQEIAEEDLGPYIGSGPIHVDDWPILERSAPKSFFLRARVRLPEVRFRFESPNTLARRYLEGRDPTPAERVHLASYLARIGTAMNTVVATLERALEEDPRNRPAMRLLAEALAREGDFRGAADWMARATLHEPAEAEDFVLLSRYRLEAARRRIGFSAPFDPNPSIEALARAVELAPGREDYRREYAALLEEAGRHAEARRQIELAGGATGLQRGTSTAGSP